MPGGGGDLVCRFCSLSHGSWGTRQLPWQPEDVRSAHSAQSLCDVLGQSQGSGHVALAPRPTGTLATGLLEPRLCHRAAFSSSKVLRREGLALALGLTSEVMGGAVPCPLGGSQPPEWCSHPGGLQRAASAA